MHGHPDLVQILLTDATATITGPNGETNQFQGKAGQVNWRLAVVHSVQNTGGTSFEGALVEMKGEPKGSAS